MRKPLVIGLFSSKANVGKTTLAFLLAWWFATERHQRVKVHDADPSHETLKRWMEALDEAIKAQPDDQTPLEPIPFEWDSSIGESTLLRIDSEFPNYDVVILDIGGGHDKLAMASAKHCDLMIVASGDSLLEDVTVDEAFDAVRVGEQRHKRTVEKALVLTRLRPGATRLIKAQQDEYMRAQEEDNTADADAIGVFDHAFWSRTRYKDLGFRHPDEVGVSVATDADGNLSEIGLIGAEIEELMEVSDGT